MPDHRANAAFYFGPANYQTGGSGIVGRQSASGGFLRGFVQHGGVRRFYYYADEASVDGAFRNFIAESGGPPTAVSGVLPLTMDRLGEVGTLFRPGPDIGGPAWLRRRFDAAAFSICGITHTISDAAALEVVARLATAPCEPWDALVCTSQTAKSVVERLVEGWRAYLGERLGTTPNIPFQLPIIPLGVEITAYADRPERRRDLRDQMGILDGHVALLYSGRLDHLNKANPIPMYLALETATKKSMQPLHLIQAGQAANPEMEAAFKQAAMTFAPSVVHHFIDGRRDDLYAGVWSAADIFISLSDNIQETFGLTPLEAMAAGLPVVVSDWNGYRESVRHGIDGFTIPTFAPPPGAGDEVAFLTASGHTGHQTLTAAACQSTAVDVGGCAAAILRLADDPELRRRMGQAGRQRVTETYDWRRVVAAHQDLWMELAEIRAGAKTPPPLAAPPDYVSEQPMCPDPFALFRDHPTAWIGGDTGLAVVEGAKDNLKALRDSGIATPLAPMLLDVGDTAGVLEFIEDANITTVGDLLAGAPRERLTPLYLTLGWLAKMNLIRLSAGAGDHQPPRPPFGVSETWRKLADG